MIGIMVGTTPFAVLIFLTLTATVSAFSLGVLSPYGLIKMQVGETLELICSLNNVTDTYNSGTLKFRKNGNNVVDGYENHQVFRLNDSSIMLRLENAQEQNSIYLCQQNMSGINVVEVMVGTSPKEVTDFKCNSINWEKMNCSFYIGYNPINTNYTLHYGRDADSFVNTMTLKPINSAQNKTRTKYEFELLSYNKVIANYSFTLHMQNEFGERNQTFFVDNFASIRPAKPLSLINENISPNEVKIIWNITYVLIPLTLGNIVTELNYTSEFDNNVWKSIVIEEKPRKTFTYTLSNLTAYTWYDIRIRIKVSRATRDELWSDRVTTVFKTLPKRPDKAPGTDIGSFSVNDLNDVVIYWRQLKPQEKNGPNFTYVINRLSINGYPNRYSGNMTDIMAKYTTMPDAEIDFELVSANSNGHSHERSYIKIPPKHERLDYPRELKKNRNGTVYTLSWKEPLKKARLVKSYTVFWCNSKAEQPNRCESSIDFEQVDASVNNYSINSTEGINFAVSANSHVSSSGMTWALCTAGQSDDIGKLKTIWISRSGATFIELQWILECMDKPIVTEYNLTYCPIISPKNPTCKSGTALNKTLDASHTQYNITGLKPYTTYKTVIIMKSKTRSGPPSEPLVNTTLEATPSQPLNLMAYEVQNTSVLLTWNAPEHLNGVINNYEIWYNEHKISYYDGISGKSSLKYRLQDLNTYTQYKIVVRACTHCCNCSENSNSVVITTSIGKPDSFNLQYSYNDSDKKIFLEWKPPAHPAGNLDFYEVQTITRRKDNPQEITVKTKKTKCFIVIDCDPNTVMEFKVRAVNVIWSAHGNNRHLVRRRRKRFGNDLSLVHEDVYIESHPSMVPHHRHHLLDLKITELKKDDHSKNSHMMAHPCDVDDYDVRSQVDLDPYSTELPGNWSIPYIHSCSDHQIATIKYMWIFIALTSLIMFVLMVFACKRYKKMKDIDVVLPPGLQDISDKFVGLNNSKTSGIAQNGGLIITSRSIETHINSKDLDDGSEISRKEDEFRDKNNTTSNSSDTCSLHEQEQSLLPSDVMDSNSSAQNSLEQFECILPPIVLPDPLKTPIIIAPTLIEQPVVPITLNKPAPNSYVTIAQRSNGYTKLDDLKPIPFVTETDEKGITGYVTHKQLADFGQRMQ